MTQAEFMILSCRRLPASLNVIWTAHLLGVHPDDVSLLVEGKMLQRQGKAKKGKMFFYRDDVEALAASKENMNKARILIEKKNSKKNAAKKGRTTAKKAKMPDNVVSIEDGAA